HRDSAGRRRDDPGRRRRARGVRLVKDFVGTGLRFPIKVNAHGSLATSDGPDRVQDAIWIILSTSPGERVMCPTFGAGVNDFVFQDNSAPIRAKLASAIKQALLD